MTLDARRCFLLVRERVQHSDCERNAFISRARDEGLRPVPSVALAVHLGVELLSYILSRAVIITRATGKFLEVSQFTAFAVSQNMHLFNLRSSFTHV